MSVYAPALPRASQSHRHGMGFAEVREEVVQSCLDNPHEIESISETRQCMYGLPIERNARLWPSLARRIRVMLRLRQRSSHALAA
jgi:uncharacterized DUF497 family protein